MRRNYSGIFLWKQFRVHRLISLALIWNKVLLALHSSLSPTMNPPGMPIPHIDGEKNLVNVCCLLALLENEADQQYAIEKIKVKCIMRISIVSNYVLIGESISCLLLEAGFNVGAIVTSIDEAASENYFNNVNVVIMTDPAFRDPTATTLKRLQVVSQGLPVILVSLFSAQPMPLRLLFRYSVRAVLDADCTPGELCNAVKSVGSGKNFITQAVAQQLATEFELPYNRELKLSAREEEILLLIAQGIRLNEIARKLFLSAKTVSTHKSNIMSRLNLKSTCDIVQYALEQGWIRPRLK